jgi:hypothetical protein
VRQVTLARFLQLVNNKFGCAVFCQLRENGYLLLDYYGLYYKETIAQQRSE